VSTQHLSEDVVSKTTRLTWSLTRLPEHGPDADSEASDSELEDLHASESTPLERRDDNRLSPISYTGSPPWEPVELSLLASTVTPVALSFDDLAKIPVELTPAPTALPTILEPRSVGIVAPDRGVPREVELTRHADDIPHVLSHEVPMHSAPTHDVDTKSFQDRLVEAFAVPAAIKRSYNRTLGRKHVANFDSSPLSESGDSPFLPPQIRRSRLTTELTFLREVRPGSKEEQKRHDLLIGHAQRAQGVNQRVVTRQNVLDLAAHGRRRIHRTTVMKPML
jgi:hypothetical protein